ncbi:MAG: tetratricopeptide repeat protein, partial [Microcoleus sp.]
MEETRAQAYLELIETLLNCPNGEENQILNANSELVDAELVQTMVAFAIRLGDNQKNKANILLDIATKIAILLGNERVDSEIYEKNSSQEHINFILELLQAEEDSNSDIKVIYPMLAGRQHLLNARFAETLQQVAQNLIADANSERIRSIIGTFENLSIDIYQFTLGSRANNLEIAIAGYQIVLNNREPGSEKFAQTQNNLAAAYSDRIRGEKAENIELAIASYTAALTIYKPEAFPQYWAQTQNNLANAYYSRIRGEKAENIELAIASYTAALTVRTPDAFPQDWA